jgi:lysophospholipase L1-like esterase
MPRKNTTKKIVKKSKKSKFPQLAKISLLFGTVAAVVIGAFAVTTHAGSQVTYQESIFTWTPANTATFVTDSSASDGKAVKLTKATTGTLTSTTGGLVALNINARGDQCKAAPIMQVSLDGAIIANTNVDATTWTDYSYPLNIPAGNHRLQIGFTNNYTSVFLGSVSCVRALYIDSATFTTQGDTNPSPSPSPSPSQGPTALQPGDEYVAMGDSYSSGWGADRTPSNLTPDTSVYDKSNKCDHNTIYGDQYLLARDLSLALTDVACGGASTRHILTVSQFSGVPPQIQAIKPSTKLVTFTIGGNDTGLIYLLTICIKTSGTCNPKGTTSQQVDKATSELPVNLNKIYQQIADTAPNAAVRQAGYPEIISPPGEPTGTCSKWLNASDQKLFNDKLVAVNNTIKQTIESFAANTGRDFKYVDPLATDSPFMQRASDGQLLNACSTNLGRYMNGPNDGTSGAWHPNIYGQQYYEQIYKASL